jgi:hypothetical protein
MPRPQFETIVASATRKVLKYEELATETNTFIVPSNDWVSIDFFATPGKIGKLKTLRFDVGALNATSGNHSLTVMSTKDQGGEHLYGVANFDQRVSFITSGFPGGMQTVMPEDHASQLLSLGSAYFDNNIGLRFEYANWTDVSVTVDDLKIVWIEEQLGGK